MGERLDNATALYMRAINDGDYVDAITAYSGDRYTQHSTPVRDGREGFIEFFANFVERNPDREIQIVRSFEDGRYVFLHVVQILNGGEFRYVTADIFDTDDQARMIEHWDIIAEWVEPTPSGHTPVDGPTEPTDLDKADENKAAVRSFLDEVLTTGDFARLSEFVSTESFVQHNAEIADGIDGFQSHVDALAADGQALRWVEVHNVIGSGDMVVALSEVARGETRLAVIDLFRVADGKIVEHWDVIEEIIPEDEWVNSGKF